LWPANGAMRNPWPDMRPDSQSFRKNRQQLATSAIGKRVKAGESALEARFGGVAKW
jgi:hypothetical protein